MQDLNDMMFFAEVVDRGGFAAAGRALGIPKSRLSRRIAELEDRLGVRLLQRTTRKLSLTQAGELFHRHCVAVREEAEAAAGAVAVVRAEPRGTIRISCPVTVAQTTLAPLLPLFHEHYPQVRIDLLVTNRVIDLVQEGVDVALRVRPTVDNSGSQVVKRLTRTYGLLVAGKKFLDRHGRPERPDDLARLPTVAMSAVNGRHAWTLSGPEGQRHELQHQPVMVADDLMVLIEAVTGGVGMCVLPDYLCRRELRAGVLEQVLPGWAPAPGVMHAVFPSRRGLMPAVRAFLDFIGEHITAEGVNCPG